MGIGIAGADLGTLQRAGAVPITVRGAITYAAGSTGAIGTTTLFTVTGDVAIVGFSGKSTTSCTSAGAPTFDLGVVGNTALFGSAVDITGLTVGKWVDSGGGSYPTGGNKAIIPNALNDAGGVVTISANIVQTIASATITGGVVRWYLQYVPLSSDGVVSLHANLTAF